MIADDSRKAAVRTAAMVQILLQKLQVLIFRFQRPDVELPAQRLPQEVIDRPGIDLDHPVFLEKLVQVLTDGIAADVQHRTHFLRGKRLQRLKVHLSGLLFQIVVQLLLGRIQFLQICHCHLCSCCFSSGQPLFRKGTTSSDHTSSKNFLLSSACTVTTTLLLGTTTMY